MDHSLNEGPDKIIAASNLTTIEPDGAVKFRSVETKDAAIIPESLPGMLARIAARYPDQAALAYKKNPEQEWFHFINYREYLNLVRTVAKGFLKLGLERYHSVAIIGFNSPEWMISYLAAIHAGGFAAGIYQTNSPETCFYCLENSRANIIIAQDHALVEKMLKNRKDLPNLKAIIQYEGTPIAKDVISWDDLLKIGQAENDMVLDSVLKTISINQCASIVYTSGTVGNPKPAMISHDNISFTSKIGINVADLQLHDTSVTFLPLSHMAAQILDIIRPIALAGTVYFANKDALKGSLIKTLQEVRPTFFFGVPRVYEKIAEKMKEVGSQAGIIAQWIGSWAKYHGLKRHMDLTKRIDSCTFAYLLAKAIVFSRVKRNLGLDNCKWFFCGGAPLSVDIKIYFASLDIPILEVYGMTECCGPHATNTYTALKIEGVGKTIPGVKTKIYAPDEDHQGEVCMYGRHVFMGYLNDRKSTENAIDQDGWLHTGDLGKIDENGFLYITGRQKELLITAGGENIPPVILEDNIKKELPCVGYAVVIGDQRKYLTALLTLSCELNTETNEASEQLTELTKKWLKDLGCPFSTMKEVMASGPDKKIMKAIQSGIDAANQKAISSAQKIQKFAILAHDFSITTEEIGPTMKLRRNVVNEKYKNIIEQFYQI